METDSDSSYRSAGDSVAVSGSGVPVLRPNASINDCERLVRDTDGWNRATFDLVGPLGRIKAKWLDAYMGLLTIEGSGGFVLARHFDRPDIHCENFAIPATGAPHAE